MMKRVGSLLVTAMVLAACSESTVLTGTNEVARVAPPSAGPENVLAEVSCKVDVAANKMSCGPTGPNLAAGVSADVILGGQNTYVKLTSTIVPSASDSVVADVTVQNLTVQPWATTNGTTSSTYGVVVFFHTGPTNGVTVANPDTTGTFTAATQPAFWYRDLALGADGILSGVSGAVAGEISQAKRWRFARNGFAGSFTFTVLITTKTPDDGGILRWVPDNTLASVAYLSTVWGSSASDVWVGGTAGAGSLQHFDGATWTSFPSAETANVVGLWGSASNDVWAIGGTKTQRWTGASWADVANPSTAALFGIWGSSASNIYAGGNTGTLINWNGASWSAVPGTGLGTEYVWAVWGSGPSDVYIGGKSVRRFDGTSWNVVATGLNFTGGNGVRSLWGSAANDVWIGGTSGQLVRYNGTTWTNMSIAGFGTNDISGIWGTGPNDVYVLDRDGGNIWHYNGSSWVVFNNSGQSLVAIWGSGRQNVWAVGSDVGTTTRYATHGIR